MGFINSTLWNNLQLSEATNEKRFGPLGLVDAAAESTAAVDYIPPSAVEAFNSVSSLRNIEIPVIKDQTVTVVTTPGFNHIPDNLPESDKYSFTAYDVFSGFRHTRSAYANNMVDENFAVEQVMRNVAHGMGKTIEGILSTVLESRKTQTLGHTTQVSQGDGTFVFDGGSDTLNVSKAAQKETMFYNLNALMAANDLDGMYRLISSRAGMAAQIAESLKYGANNDKNIQSLGFLPLDRIHETDTVSAGSDIFNGYFLRDGAIGMYENFPYDFRNGSVVGGKQWNISDVEIPFTRMRANIYTNSEATDATALITSGADSNVKMTHFEEMAIWVRFYVVHRYNSDLTTRANDIVKISGKTS